ncbi:MAG: hypothetical protein LBF27_14305 [Sphingobacterium sp.]|jgi:hypothetical protein|nr:hypothetical protein [Sphingobacterium sp.]
MIFKFNEAVFNCEDIAVQKALIRIFCDFLDDRFLWDLDNLTYLFYNNDRDIQIIEESILWTGIGDILQREIAESTYVKTQLGSYVTDKMKYYLQTLTVGLENDEVNPIQVIKILTYKSHVIVENNLNDWNFITGIVNNYANFSGKKSIYKLIKKSIEKQFLESKGFGGGGEIKKNLESLVANSYEGIHTYKLAALFDSDRESLDVNINNGIYKLLVTLKKRDFDRTDPSELVYSNGDLIGWHMLYKREIENYIPLELLYSKFPTIDGERKKELNKLDNSQLDFYNFDACKEITKNEASEIFLATPIREQLANRCMHHKVRIETPNDILEEVDELEKILLMLAKII